MPKGTALGTGGTPIQTAQPGFTFGEELTSEAVHRLVTTGIKPHGPTSVFLFAVSVFLSDVIDEYDLLPAIVLKHTGCQAVQ